MDHKDLIHAALQARKLSYAPYSHFMVGAALLTGMGRIYTGANVEICSYGATNCAERTAFFTAVSKGERDFRAIAIVGAYSGTPDGSMGLAYPCGLCRQVMMEFCNPKIFRVIIAASETDFETYTLEELLPFGFGPKNLER